MAQFGSSQNGLKIEELSGKKGNTLCVDNYEYILKASLFSVHFRRTLLFLYHELIIQCLGVKSNNDNLYPEGSNKQFFFC